MYLPPSRPKATKGAGNVGKNLLKVDRNYSRSFDSHFSKHVIKQGEYGREAIYNVKTNELVIVHDGAQIETFFKPTGGINYFKSTLK